MEKFKVLVVDDEESVRKLVSTALEGENIKVFHATDGRQALTMIEQGAFDLIILDILMEDINGYDVISQIRAQGIDTPVFLLSGMDTDNHKIIGYGIGADAYITKPFSPAVLCAAVKSHIKRYQEFLETKESSIKLQSGPFVFNLKTYTFYKDDEQIFLSSKELLLMKFFMEHPDQVFSKEQLYQNVWNDFMVDDNTIMVYIRRLRSKIEDDPDKPKYIQTVWGIGYKFTTAD